MRIYFADERNTWTIVEGIELTGGSSSPVEQHERFTCNVSLPLSDHFPRESNGNSPESSRTNNEITWSERGLNVVRTAMIINDTSGGMYAPILQDTGINSRL